VAIFGAAALAIFGHALDERLAQLGNSPELAETVAAIKRTLAGTDLPATLPAETRAALQAVISAAFAVTFRLLMLGAAGLALLAALCALATIPAERLSSQ